MKLLNYIVFSIVMCVAVGCVSVNGGNSPLLRVSKTTSHNFFDIEEKVYNVYKVSIELENKGLENILISNYKKDRLGVSTIGATVGISMDAKSTVDISIASKEVMSEEEILALLPNLAQLDGSTIDFDGKESVLPFCSGRIMGFEKKSSIKNTPKTSSLKILVDNEKQDKCIVKAEINISDREKLNVLVNNKQILSRDMSFNDYAAVTLEWKLNLMKAQAISGVYRFSGNVELYIDQL